MQLPAGRRMMMMAQVWLSLVCLTSSQLLEENLQYQDQIASGAYQSVVSPAVQQSASPSAYGQVEYAQQPAGGVSPQYVGGQVSPVQQNANPYAYGQGGAYAQQPYGGVSAQYVGKVSQQYDEAIPPPLVTDQSEEEASKLYPGKEIPDLSHRHIIRMAALRRQLSMYGDTPAWVFIGSFLGMVGGMTGFWLLAKNQWEINQDEASL